jgi:hypothetical protein
VKNTFARRTPEQIAAYKPGTILSYHGQGETFSATKHENGTWIVDGIGDVTDFLSKTTTALEFLPESPCPL